MKNSSIGIVRCFPLRLSEIVAPNTIRAGEESPIGEPFAIFPPIVAACLTCVDPYRLNNSENSG